jgi:hypothetical protein
VIDVAAADIAERAGEYHDGQTVREGDPWYVSAAERRPRAGAPTGDDPTEHLISPCRFAEAISFMR